MVLVLVVPRNPSMVVDLIQIIMEVNQLVVILVEDLQEAAID